MALKSSVRGMKHLFGETCSYAPTCASTVKGGILTDSLTVIKDLALFPLKLAAEQVLLPVKVALPIIQGRRIDVVDLIPLGSTARAIISRMKGGRVLVYDDTDGVTLKAWWKAGHLLEGNLLSRFDYIIPAHNWLQVANELKTIASAYGKIHEVQSWGHGDIGAVCIGVKPKQDRLTVKSLETSWSSMNKVMAPDSLFWFRSCSTFRDTEGKEFAKSFSAALGCRVAGHTCIIGAFHGGLVFVDPGQNPSWKDGETGISCAALDMSVKELGN